MSRRKVQADYVPDVYKRVEYKYPSHTDLHICNDMFRGKAHGDAKREHKKSSNQSELKPPVRFILVAQHLNKAHKVGKNGKNTNYNADIRFDKRGEYKAVHSEGAHYKI